MKTSVSVAWTPLRRRSKDFWHLLSCTVGCAAGNLDEITPPKGTTVTPEWGRTHPPYSHLKVKGAIFPTHFPLLRQLSAPKKLPQRSCCMLCFGRNPPSSKSGVLQWVRIWDVMYVCRGLRGSRRKSDSVIIERLLSGKKQKTLWKMMVGELLSFRDCNFQRLS